MLIKIWYESGRIDAFDTQSLMSSRPFSSNALLADFEVRLDQLGERGLWLEAHYYDADPSYRDAADGETPVARRKRGWRMLLAEKGELNKVERVAVDSQDVLVRIGPDLADAVRLSRWESLLVGNAQSGVCGKALAIQTVLANAYEEPAEDIAARMGVTLASLEFAASMQAMSPQLGSVAEEEDWEDEEEYL